MENPIQPIVPEGTPLPTPPVGVPPYPITPFAVWTWNTPVIPSFYWNIYSAEQRIKSICKEIGKIEAYLQYLVTKTNENIIEIHRLITALTERVAALEKKVEEEVARLDALIAKLREDLEQEIQDRQDADQALDSKIEQEITDRTHGDESLHGEITAEATARIHADDALHEEISDETQARIHADDALHVEISKRLLPTDVQAGAEIEITRPDPNSNTIIIASTVAHSIAELASTVSGIQAALTAETEERRADDAALWTAVNNRIERGKILAGTGIKVENDPDQSTVTISATGGGTGGSTVVAGEGITVETDGDTSTVSLATPYPSVEGEAPVVVEAREEQTGTKYEVSVSEATEDEAGVISEARVKEIAPEITLSSSGDVLDVVIDRTNFALRQTIAYEEEYGSGDPTILRNLYLGPESTYVSSPVEGYVEGSGLRFTKSTSQKGFRLGVKTGTGITISGKGEVVATTATEAAPGIISEARVKELAGSVAPSLSAEAPLKLEDGTLSLTKDPAGPVTSSAAGLSVREITPETESESEAGVVSKATVKSLLEPFSGSVNPNGGLEIDGQGLLGVKTGANPWQNPIGVGPDGELTFIGSSTAQVVSEGVDVVAEPISGSTFWPSGFWDGKPDFAASTPAGTPASKAEFVLSSGYFEVRKAGSSTWEAAEDGTFELVSYPSKLREGGAAAGYPIEHSIYSRITPYGQAYYTPTEPEESSSAVHIIGMRVHYSYYTLYVLPVSE